MALEEEQRCLGTNIRVLVKPEDTDDSVVLLSYVPNTFDEYVELVSEKIPAELEKICPDQDQRDCLEYAIDEAMNNAWKHGNKEDESKNLDVCIMFFPNNNYLLFSVTNGGCGMDFDRITKIYEAGLPPFGTESGRGLAIIKEAFPEIHFIKYISKNDSYTEFVGMTKIISGNS